MSLQKIFIENVKYYRLKKNLSQAKLAEKCNLSSGMIGKIESYSTNPSFKTIEKISKALHIEPHMLFLDRSNPEKYKESLYDDFVKDIKHVLQVYEDDINKGPQSNNNAGNS